MELGSLLPSPLWGGVGGGVTFSAARLGSGKNDLSDGFGRPQHFVIPEAQYPKPLRLKPGRTPQIVASNRHGMLAAIDFDNEPPGKPGKINDELAERCLATKMKAKRF